MVSRHSEAKTGQQEAAREQRMANQTAVKFASRQQRIAAMFKHGWRAFEMSLLDGSAGEATGTAGARPLLAAGAKMPAATAYMAAGTAPGI
jgi:hypothetical protein